MTLPSNQPVQPVMPPFSDVYIIKDSGVCFFSWSNGKNPGIDGNDDLVAPFLAAIDAFAATNLDGRQIKCIELDDGMKVYFKNIKLSGDTMVKIIITFPGGFHDFKTIDKNVLSLKWDLDKIVGTINKATILSRDARDDLKDRMASLFA